MTTILILNIALAALVVGGIVSLLAWGIASDRVHAPRASRAWAQAHRNLPHPAGSPARATRAPAARIGASRA